jgi:hypothetical protein
MPCNVPLPAARRCRHHRTIVPAAQVPIRVLNPNHRLLSENIPAVAVLEGWLTIVNLLAAAALTTTFEEALPAKPHC